MVSLKLLVLWCVKMKKSKKPCAYPRCKNLTDGHFCLEHQDRAKADKRSRDRYYDEFIRDKQIANFYKSKSWLTTRQLVLMRDNYLCQFCLREKVIRYADCVHHIVEIKDDRSKRLDLNNLISLCYTCHNRIHNSL